MQTHRFKVMACAFAFGFAVNPAHAAIEIVEARYEAGVLVVRGNSNHPNMDVMLDGIYKEQTGHSGEFLFRVRYRPRGCVAAVRIKDENVSTNVASCAEPHKGGARP